MGAPRGPLTLLLTSRRFRRWLLVVVAGVPTVYLASFGPACWWFSTDGLKYPPLRFRGDDRDYVYPCTYAPKLYWPIGWVAVSGPRPLGKIICQYANATATANMEVMVPYGWNGKSWVDSNRWVCNWQPILNSDRKPLRLRLRTLLRRRFGRSEAGDVRPGQCRGVG